MFSRKSLVIFAASCAGLTAYGFRKFQVKIASCAESANSTTEISEDDSELGSSKSIISRMEKLITRAQSTFCKEIERLDGGKRFTIEKYKRQHDNGYGVACVLQDGKVFEKACVLLNVSSGNLTKGMEHHLRAIGKKIVRGESGELRYDTLGISCVVHPLNPHCPSLHYNYRYFEITDGNNQKTWWFGGGIDMTPSYLDVEDVRNFHKTVKEVCDKHDKSYYSQFKRWCDQYHYIKIHAEHRGVGGIFFDDLDSDDPAKVFDFITSCVASIIPCYIPIIEKNMNKKFTSFEKNWQQMRRGRYVEFNLLYDRGVKFGLASPNARIENILASLPLTARWEYNDGWLPESGTPEYEMLQVLKKPRDWV